MLLEIVAKSKGNLRFVIKAIVIKMGPFMVKRVG